MGMRRSKASVERCPDLCPPQLVADAAAETRTTTGGEKPMGEAAGFCAGHCGGGGNGAQGRGQEGEAEGCGTRLFFLLGPAKRGFWKQRGWRRCGGSGAARGKEVRGSTWERRDGTPGRAPHGKGCTLEEQRLVAENDVEPGLGWLAAACGRRIWRWGCGPGAARPRSDGSAGVVSGGCGRRVWDRDGRPHLEICLGFFLCI